MATLYETPRSVKVHVTSGAGVDVVWADGHTSHFDFAYLRDQCPCAVCNDERERKAQEKNKAAVLPMFKEKVKARAARPIGSYAIQIDFSDGHATGIYSFGFLRSICPCAECTAQAVTSA